MGYAITSHMAQYKELRPKLRVLCQNKARCYGFINAGIDVRQVDYHHPNQISLGLRGIDHIILAIGSEPDRVENAKRICRVAAHSGVSNIVCVSHIGAVSRMHPSLQDYHIIEEQVMHSHCQYTILRYTCHFTFVITRTKQTMLAHFDRLDFVQQYLHLWANYAEKNRKMILPLREDTEICPVDISDVCRVIEELVLDKTSEALKPLDDRHDGQVYSLTGPESISGKRMVELLCQATGYQSFKYCHGRPMDLVYYMSGLAKDVWFDARLKREMSQIYHDTFETAAYREKAYCTPTGI
ncbi:uncharacterized protein EV154DRAFT_504883, partial [Mucor mucedo]|uniref:uncharacterized protein n=1 Tax=Mucor mucedo TaxID=29922 RepID=UPI0022211B9D